MARIEQAQRMLAALGLPKHQQNEMSALTLLALCGVGPRTPWKRARRASLTITKGIMAFIEERYRRQYAPNTRETFRRQVLHQFVQAGIAEYNPDDPTLPTNSPRAHYAISAAALSVVRTFGTTEWASACAALATKRRPLLEVYATPRDLHMVVLRSHDGGEVRLSPGRHSTLQVAIVQEFGPRFAPAARLVYLGDTAKKKLIQDERSLSELGLLLTGHDKLPDVLLWDTRRGWLFVIEAATSHGPVTPKRRVELEGVFGHLQLGMVYVSAFPDFREFGRHLSQIAWDTEVWIADSPDHIIHYNGDRFLGPR